MRPKTIRDPTWSNFDEILNDWLINILLLNIKWVINAMFRKWHFYLNYYLLEEQ